MADDLDMLATERDISVCLKQYCRAIDRLDQDLLVTIWHPEGTIDDLITGSRGRVADLVPEIFSRLRSAKTHVHAITDPIISLDGDAATTDTKFMHIQRLDNAGNDQSEDRHMYGFYRDRWSRRDGRWGIDHREVVELVFWEQRVGPSATGAYTRRDPSDPGSVHLDQIASAPYFNGDVSSQARLSTLFAERDILNQLNTYCRGLDRFDLELWRSAWHPDATLDYESGDIFGSAMDRSLQMTCGHAAMFTVHSHQITNPTIRVEGNRAVSETYANAVLRGYPDRAANQIDWHYLGRYLDNWSCRDGRWAIDNRRLVEELMWQQPVLRPRTGRTTRRDREDPSYELFQYPEKPHKFDLATLFAEREIRRQVMQYCNAIDRRDSQMWQSLWHERATLDLESIDTSGLAVDMLDTLWANAEAQSIAATNSRIAVDGDYAISETGIAVVLRTTCDGRPALELSRGRLLDRWSKRDGRWAVDHRRQIEDFAWSEPCQG
ncbi:MAG: nuclear transport factor 2 family protein [Hyphomicrobiales bacterium]|nr:nuclear transport factor 2 family protein [Hyphomicrobiales bacterium]